MKKKILLLIFLLLPFGGNMFAQSTESKPEKQSTEWIVVKESALDSLTFSYYKEKGWIQYAEPKNENNNVFMSVTGYIANLLDETLSAVSRNTNKFYETPVGFWATWGVFYHYVGSEFMEYFWEFVYLLIVTIMFVWCWSRYCIPKMIPEKQHRESVDDPEDGIISYEIKKVSANMQFWLLVVYLCLFCIAIIMLCN